MNSRIWQEGTAFRGRHPLRGESGHMKWAFGWVELVVAMTVCGEWEQISDLERRLKKPSYPLCETFEMIKLKNNGCPLFEISVHSLHEIEKKKKDETNLAVPPKCSPHFSLPIP